MPTLNSFIPDWRANAAPAYKPSTLATMESSIRHWLLPAPIKENQGENQSAFLTTTQPSPQAASRSSPTVAFCHQ
jgi:hypothetical protein